ncbi:hypothetical protein BC941DRAFT_398404 [Chlamydoabsidia padenii]|nr:hypothetical protein BC941DRAFT_398404 [Chlamydoabsidia padenii]
MPKKHSADDDSESQKRTDVQSPEVCVDYLSYTFDEMDLAASWRMMTKQKKDIVNGIRLENASWRTWAKQRNHLKTISPETLNWLKDSDVTWLYGPLHTVTKSEQNDRYAPKESSAHDKFGLIHASDLPLTDKAITGTPSAPPLPSTTVTRTTSNTIGAPDINNPVDATTAAITSTSPSPSPSPKQQQQQKQPQQQQERRPLKSALKKVTMSDILRRSASEFHVSDLNEPGATSISLSEANRQLGAFSPAVIATHRQPKLRFNQRVEQYMVISDDDASSANGSLPKVKMTANLPSRYEVNSDRTNTGATGRQSESHDNTGGYHSKNRTTTNVDDTSTDEEHLENVMDENGNDSDNGIQSGYQHRNDNGQLYRRASRYMVSSDEEDDEDEDDEDEDEDGGIVMYHHHHNNNNNTPRSIKRIEPTILKCSSYSDNSVASSLSRRGSLSSWDDNDDDDRRSVHLPDYQLHRRANNTSNQSSIQWEGQTCVVYDVAPSDMDSDFVDDDWDLQRQSPDNNDNSVDDNDIDDIGNVNIVIDYGTSTSSTSSSTSSSNTPNDPVRQKSPMQVDVPKSRQPIDPPTILSPGKASKSQPTSEPSTIDAIHTGSSSSSSSSSDPITDRQQQSSSPSVFGNIGHWASSYFWKS